MATARSLALGFTTRIGTSTTIGSIILRCFAIGATCRSTPEQGRLAGTYTTGSVRCPKVKPERAIIPQHPPHVPEHLHHFVEVFVRRLLKAELRVDATGAALVPGIASLYGCVAVRPRCAVFSQLAITPKHQPLVGRFLLVVASIIPTFPLSRPVVPQPPVRRRRDAALHARIGQRTQHVAAVSMKNANPVLLVVGLQDFAPSPAASRIAARFATRSSYSL